MVGDGNDVVAVVIGLNQPLFWIDLSIRARGVNVEIAYHDLIIVDLWETVYAALGLTQAQWKM